MEYPSLENFNIYHIMDTCTYWIGRLVSMFNTLNLPMINVLDDALNVIDKTSSAHALLDGLKAVLTLLGFGDFTFIEFTLSFCGFGFGVFACLSLVKWLIDILP